MSQEVALEIKNLFKTYDSDILKKKTDVLKGLNLFVNKGEIYGFLGPNGAGKTTTIKTITGLITPDKGEILVSGHPADSPEAKRKIGFMPERPGFYNHLTGRELLEFFADLLGLDEKKRKIDQLLTQVNLEKKADAKVGSYSKGMLQRIALAQALINDPEVVILDEPMSGLDPIGRREVRDIMLELAENGTTIFFSSHIIPDVENICDRVAILINGKVQAEGEIEEIVSLEVEEFELSFINASGSLSIKPLSEHAGSDSHWMRITAEDKNKVIKEISDAGGEILRLNPVRRSLEDVLIGKYQEVSK